MKPEFEQLSPHILLMHATHETDRPIVAAIMGERRTLLMDAGNSPAHAELFREELSRRGYRQPDLLALTHWHWDHSFGMPGWNLPAVAHSGTAGMLAQLAGLDWSDECLDTLIAEGILNKDSAEHIRKEYGDPKEIQIIQPDIAFSDQLVIDLGGITCELRHVGGDHAADSCILHVKEEGILFLGDALGPSVYGGPRRYSSSEFLRLLGIAYGYEAQWYVESHDRPMSNQAFRAELRSWERLARVVDVFGNDRERVALEMKGYLKLDQLPEDLLKGIEYFMAGAQ
ncbi:MBL fold metallo-hydrolase [Paenibacillus albidus]|uniref:MBL fold metallo-hydrolase n=1 Tax=Paenibacillus albidus TaxID=2041023 RepID=UPI001BEC1409|nr:MBL fold metallo-hydrolase [Paenibacillus albidus]MBT2291279.1 MBL fold metallo-hydrolase [Paenibacillus albidus]